MSIQNSAKMIMGFDLASEGSDRTVFTMHSMFGKNIISKYPDESDADFIKRVKQLNKVELDYVICDSCYAVVSIDVQIDNCPQCEAKLPSEATDAE
jgi:ribosomal protein L40E